MGGGSYSVSARTERATSLGYFTKSVHETFSQKSINNAMNPFGVKLRESRDSTEHPASLAIVLALDVTGSMGTVPHNLVKNGLPTMVDRIIKAGIQHPQILFLGIGDHECDQSPLQVGQFESSDKLLDKWLTDIYLEGGGGGNAGESYLLAWYFAGYRTATDCFEKRQQKGFLFTIGDEPTLREIPKSVIEKIMGDGQYENFSAAALLDKARELYNVYHILIRETSAGSRNQTLDGWKQLMGDNLIIAQHHDQVPELIAEKVIQSPVRVIQSSGQTMIPVEEKKEEMIL
jgi:hypothetical protein